MKKWIGCIGKQLSWKIKKEWQQKTIEKTVPQLCMFISKAFTGFQLKNFARKIKSIKNLSIKVTSYIKKYWRKRKNHQVLNKILYNKPT